MANYIVVFKSRNDAVAFMRSFMQNGEKATIINTPPNYVSGCSLSVKIPSAAYGLAQRLIARGLYPTYVGIFNL